MELVAYLPGSLVDLGADSGELFLADATSSSIQRLRPPATSAETLFTLPSPPTKLLVTAEALFVGSRAGGVYRLDRRGGTALQLGQLAGEITALALSGCQLLAGSSSELAALSPTAGGVLPLARSVVVSAIAVQRGQVLFADVGRSEVSMVSLPACAANFAGSALPVVAASPVKAVAAPPDPPDTDALAGRSRSSLHTVLLRLQSEHDELAEKLVSRRVTKLVASVTSELWVRASDAQLASLSQDGFWIYYRDGVDRLRCVDIRSTPEAARRPPPAPFYDSGSPRVYLLQLEVPSSALPGLQEELATRGLNILESEGATLTVSGSVGALGKLGHLPHVTWSGPYGVRERLLVLATGLVEQEGPCRGAGGDNDSGGSGGAPDVLLRRLAAWIREAPTAELKLNALLFAPSQSFVRLVRSLGGKLSESAGEQLTLTIRRQVLPALAAHPDVRLFEPYAEAGLARAE
jgi:hypothetical protein